MVTKKIPAQINTKLKFRKEWIFDPAPELKKALSPAALKALDQAKKDFGLRVDEILKKG